MASVSTAAVIRHNATTEEAIKKLVLYWLHYNNTQKFENCGKSANCYANGRKKSSAQAEKEEMRVSLEEKRFKKYNCTSTRLLPKVSRHLASH